MQYDDQIIGDYIILKMLGQGGMGVVYLSQNVKTAQLVALKTVRLPTRDLLQSIRREIHALAKINTQ